MKIGDYIYILKNRWNRGERRAIIRRHLNWPARLWNWRVMLMMIACDLADLPEAERYTTGLVVIRFVLFPIRTMKAIVDRELFGDEWILEMWNGKEAPQAR